MVSQLIFLFLARRVIPLLLAAACLITAGVALADDEDPGKLDSAVENLATKLQTFLKEEETEQVSIGAFTGQPQFDASASAAIKNKLVNALEGKEIAHKKRAPIGCKGEYFYDSEEGVVLLTMKAMKGSRQLSEWDEKIYDVQDMASLLGLSGKTSVNKPPAEQREELKAAIENPEVNTEVNVDAAKQPGAQEAGIEGPIESIAKPTGESLYAIEILRVGPEGSAPLAITNDEGLAFIDLAIEDSYVIRVINKSPHMAAVKLSIDGINMFEFSQVPHYRQLGFVLVPPSPKGSLIKGWHITNEKSDSFLVGDYAESERGKRENGILKSEDEVATITAQFAVAVPANQPFPEDEPTLKSLGTKRGPTVGAVYRERVGVRIGKVREFVSVRYARTLPPPN